MTKVVQMEPVTKSSKRMEFADKLRRVADILEGDAEHSPIAMAVVILTKEPWYEKTAALVDWSTPWPRGIFAEAVKYELLRDIEKNGERDG